MNKKNVRDEKIGALLLMPIALDKQKNIKILLCDLMYSVYTFKHV